MTNAVNRQYYLIVILPSQCYLWKVYLVWGFNENNPPPGTGKPLCWKVWFLPTPLSSNMSSQSVTHFDTGNTYKPMYECIGHVHCTKISTQNTHMVFET